MRKYNGDRSKKGIEITLSRHNIVFGEDKNTLFYILTV